jgi:hypothetical protein
MIVLVSFMSRIKREEVNLFTRRENDKHEDVFNDQIFMITTVNFYTAHEKE